MKIAALLFLTVLSLIAGTVFWGMGTYNVMVDKDENVNAAWAQVQNVYQRRLDLIPNLVETVKGAAKFERETLTDVISARASATKVSVDSSITKDPERLREFETAQSSLGGALGRLLVSMEKYPDLKANQNFQELQAEIKDTEDKIEVERHNFNEIAATYNAYLRKMPASAIAQRASFKSRAYFQSEAGAEKAPKVSF